MSIKKSRWIADSTNKLSINMDITKVDAEKRTVRGFASVDNLDKQGEIVTTDCAYNAFEKFRGNLREMHNTIAVGKVVSFWQEPIYDLETDTVYQGIVVEAYVSLGAEDTWQKVLDGTLSGFSIGAVVKDAETIYVPDINKEVRVIKEMELFELSLVDNPANQLANFVAIAKINDDNTVSGIASDVDISRVYWCDNDQISVLKHESDQPECPECGNAMNYISWIESGNDATETQKVRLVVQKYLAEQNDVAKGGKTMSKNETEITEDAIEKSGDDEKPETDVVTPDAELTEVDNDEAEEIVEDVVESNESDSVEGTLLEVHESEGLDVDAIVAEVTAAVAAQLPEYLASLKADITKAIDGLKDHITKSVGDVDESISKATENLADVEKRLDGVEKATATKKSGEHGRESDELKKSYWSGAFLTTDEL